jgi:nitronate monooxygenase
VKLGFVFSLVRPRTKERVQSKGEKMFTTTLCTILGVRHPILSAGIGAAAGAELVAAVSNAGGCGVLGTAALSAKFVRTEIGRLRKLTDKPFGVNLVLPIVRRGQFEVCLEERVPFVVLFWGVATDYVKQAHAQGVKVFMQVGSVEEARAAVDAGVDAVIAQGAEAGGHVKGQTALSVLVPSVVEAVGPTPVVASGGVATGRGLVAALSLGAQGVSIGTRFLASHEANSARAYKELIVESTSEDTVYTELFDVGWRAPHRVLRNSAYIRWDTAGRSGSGHRPGEGATVGSMTSGDSKVDVPSYSAYVPGLDSEKFLDEMAQYAGQTCSLISGVLAAEEIVKQLIEEADVVLKDLNQIYRNG